MAYKKLQIYLCTLSDYFHRWRLKINSDKTELVIFKHKRKKEEIPDLFMNDTKIVPKTEAKYLGVNLDNKLSFIKHVLSIKRKAYQIIGILSCLIGRRSTLNTKNKLTLYRAIVRPIMLYASPIWSNTCNTNINKLQTIQNRCLRMITKANSKDRNVDIHKKCNIKTIKEYMYNLTSNYFNNQIPDFEDLYEDFILYKNKKLIPFPLKYKLPYQVLLETPQ